MLRLLLDDSNIGSDAEREADLARDQFFRDEEAVEYEGANYESTEDEAATTSTPTANRESLIQKAKRNSVKNKSNKSSEQTPSQDAGSQPAGRSTSPRKKLAREDAEKPSGFNSLPEESNKKNLLKNFSKKAGDNGGNKPSNADTKKNSLPNKDNVRNIAKGPSAIGGVVMDDEKWGVVTGDALFGIWSLSAVIGSFPFMITGIPGLIMMNLLLISPRLVYRITIWILIFIPVVGEMAKAQDEVNAGKKQITIRQLEKTAIIFIDFAWLGLLLCFVAFIMAIACYSVNSMGTIQSGAAQVGEYLWYGTSLFNELKTFCTGV